jgi:hypothetical protein
VEGRDRIFFQDIIPAFAWKYWRKLKKKVVGIVDSSDEIRIEVRSIAV